MIRRFATEDWVGANTLGDAPSDGNDYVRRNGAWEQVVAAAGGGLTAEQIPYMWRELDYKGSRLTPMPQNFFRLERYGQSGGFLANSYLDVKTTTGYVYGGRLGFIGGDGSRSYGGGAGIGNSNDWLRIWSADLRGNTRTVGSINASFNRFDSATNNFINGDEIVFYAGNVDLEPNIAIGQSRWVRSRGASTYQIAASSGGSALNLNTNGLVLTSKKIMEGMTGPTDSNSSTTVGINLLAIQNYTNQGTGGRITHLSCEDQGGNFTLLSLPDGYPELKELHLKGNLLQSVIIGQYTGLELLDIRDNSMSTAGVDLTINSIGTDAEEGTLLISGNAPRSSASDAKINALVANGWTIID